MAKDKVSHTIGLRKLVPALLGKSRRLPEIAASGLSIAFLFDELPLSAGRILERNAAKFSDRIALIFEDRSWTFRTLNEEVNRLANFFSSIGIERGDVVIVYLLNRPEAVFATYALAKIGAIASLINPQQTGEVLLHSIRLRYGRHFIIGTELCDAFEDIRADLGDDITVMGMADGDRDAFPVDYIELDKETRDLSAGNPKDTSDIRTKEHMAYIFTSGTTGMPKASIQTHKKWLRCMHWFGRINLSLKEGDVLYAPLPFFHANAFLIAWPTVLTYGATLVMKRKFSVSEFWSDIRKYNATSFIYIGEMCRYLLNAPATEGDRNHHIRKIIGNGLRPEIWNEFKERFNIAEIHEFYGASDSNVIFTNTLSIDGTVGWSPVEFAIIRYDNENDEPYRNKNGRCERVAKGENGLMISKITNRFPFDGYVNKKSNSEKVLENVFSKGDQWFNSGDLMKHLGYKHTQFVDRVGDTFRWKGENVATAEVEKILHRVPEVNACAVYGVQIPNCDGRAGMAAVITSNGEKPEDLRDFAGVVRKGLPPYAVPLFIRMTPELERTHTHKIKKSNLKEEGFDPAKVSDPMYVLLPGEQEYKPLTTKIYKSICDGQYAF